MSLDYFTFVSGETGSGKSTFINLLLGENILPCSLLSNTHVICEIRQSKSGKYEAHLVKRDGSEKFIEVGDDGDKELFQTNLGTEVERTENGKPVYDVARIYAPCDILQVLGTL